MMGRAIFHVTISLYGFIATPDGAMDRGFEHPKPNASVETAIETSGLVRKKRPDVSSGCRRLDFGPTARNWRAIPPDIGAQG